ncbi:MAG: tol-pal system YbgF family protein [Crocinitomicaceae bacterium]
MKNIGIGISAFLLFMVSCNVDSETSEKIDNGDFDSLSFMQDVKSLDSVLAKGVPEKKDLKKAIVVFQDYAKYFPESTKAPNYLFQVSDFYLNMGNPERSVAVLTDIIEKYPNYDRIETVYFTRASHVDFDLRDTTLAKTYYDEFLTLYPNSEYADNAKERYKNVALSMEDLVRKFEEMNADK